MKKTDWKHLEAAPGKSGRLGAWAEADGILFAMETWADGEAALLLYAPGKTEPAAEIPLTHEYRQGRVYTVKVKGLQPGSFTYNYRVGGKVFTDPAARAVIGRSSFGVLPKPRGGHELQGGLPDPSFDWEGDVRPEIPYEESIGYAVHVRGFTKGRDSGVKNKGTFLGIVEKIPYLNELGINLLKLMPAYEFDEIMREDSVPGYQIPLEEQQTRLNYWGYGEGFYFAPKQSYSADRDASAEFKRMVRALHKAGIELIMEFSVPYTVNASFMVQALRWWAEEYHVDGFQLLTSEENLLAAARDPWLSGLKLLGFNIPAEQVYPIGYVPKQRTLAEISGGFPCTARCLLKGDEGQLAGFAEQFRKNPGQSAVVNTLASHDGFTLMDTVSYDRKHNEENGEHGADGTDYNYSWNCGVEGPTRKKKVLELRLRQQKNAFLMLLLAQGMPMLLSGDEFGNSQNGNNNPYCHDSSLTWLDWRGAVRNRELVEFVKEAIAFRKAHPVLHMKAAPRNADYLACGYPDLSYHGEKAWYGAFEQVNRNIAFMYCGTYAGEAGFIYIAFNLYWEEQNFALPNLPKGMEWRKVIDTGAGQSEEDGGETYERSFSVPGRTTVVLTAKSRSKEKQDEQQ